MTRLEELRPLTAIRGVLPDCSVTVVSVQWFGSEAVELTYKTPAGKVANELLYRYDESRLELVEQGRPWSFDGDGALFRLVSEAQRIRLAHLFDPVLAVHASVVDPLPHQITAVYLVVCPGSLAEQWQDELYRRFHLRFDILSNEKLEAVNALRTFFLAWSGSPKKLTRAVSENGTRLAAKKLPRAVSEIPWGHNIVLLQQLIGGVALWSAPGKAWIDGMEVTM